MKKIIFALIITSLLLVGCSDKSKENTSDKVNTTSSSSETNDLSGIDSNKNETPDKSENKEGNSDAESDSKSSSDKTVQADSDNSSISGGELPILTEMVGEDPVDPETKNTTSAAKNTAPSSETEIQTTESENGGVIELPIIPVK